MLEISFHLAKIGFQEYSSDIDVWANTSSRLSKIFQKECLEPEMSSNVDNEPVVPITWKLQELMFIS
jgi:hypothetical protein